MFLGDTGNTLHILGVHEPLHRFFRGRTKVYHQNMYIKIFKDPTLRNSL